MNARGMHVSAALLISALLHATALLIAAFIFLRDPPAADSPIELRFAPVPPEEQGEDQRREPVSETPPSRRSRPPVTPTPGSVPVPTQLPDLSVETPEMSAESSTPVEISRGPLERDMSPEEAFEELTRLIEEHPEFREMIVREMIAGKGFAPDTVQRIDLFLEQILGGRHRNAWLHSRQGVEWAYRSYDGVHGWRQNSNYGPQLNVFGLLKFLHDLLDDE